MFELWLPHAITFSKAWFVSPRLRIAEPTVTQGGGDGGSLGRPRYDPWRNQPASGITQYNLLDWMGRTENVPIATLRLEILEAAVT